VTAYSLKTRNSSVNEIGERYRLNHVIVVQADCQAGVCVKMCLQAVFKLLDYGTHLGWRHNAIYSTLTDIALDLLGVGSSGTFAYELNFESHSLQGRLRSFETTPMSRARASSY